MLYQGWNDYELIYLINEGNELALNLMYLKYTSMIKYKAKSCGFYSCDIDDCVQEGLLLLTKAIKSFRPSYKKTFYKYFEIILLRLFWRMKQHDSLCYEYDSNKIKDEHTLSDNLREYSSLFEGELLYIYEETFLFHTPVAEIAEQLGEKKSKIYYLLKKIREILREEFDLSYKKR